MTKLAASKFAAHLCGKCKRKSRTTAGKCLWCGAKL